MTGVLLSTGEGVTGADVGLGAVEAGATGEVGEGEGRGVTGAGEGIAGEAVGLELGAGTVGVASGRSWASVWFRKGAPANNNRVTVSSED